MKNCEMCNGTGLLLAINGGRWPGLSSTVPYKCSECDGLGKTFWENHQRCLHCGDYTDLCRCAGF